MLDVHTPTAPSVRRKEASAAAGDLVERLQTGIPVSPAVTKAEATLSAATAALHEAETALRKQRDALARRNALHCGDAQYGALEAAAMQAKDMQREAQQALVSARAAHAPAVLHACAVLGVEARTELLAILARLDAVAAALEVGRAAAVRQSGQEARLGRAWRCGNLLRAYQRHCWAHVR